MNDTPKIGQSIEGKAFRDAIHIAIAPMIAAEDLDPGEHVGLHPKDDSKATGFTEEPLGIVDPYLQNSVLKGERFYLFLYPNTVTSLRHEWTHPAFADNAPATPAKSDFLKDKEYRPSSEPAWQTDIVIKLADKVLDDWNDTGLRILADALEEADFPIPSNISMLRGGGDDIHQRKLVCEILGGDELKAIKTIEEVADACDLTFHALMDHAETWNQYDDYITQYGSENWRNNFNPSTFWPAWEINRKKPRDPSCFFSCSC